MAELFQDFYQKLNRLLSQEFPQTFSLIQDGKIKADWDHLVSPREVRLSSDSIEKMNLAVKALFKKSREARENFTTVSNLSVLMSYDFHTSDDGAAKLIEINTNASGYLISALGDAVHDGCKVQDLPAIQKLKTSFISELEHGNTKGQAAPHIAIIDDDVLNQKMLVEFYLYLELFQSWGWTAEIVEAGALTIENDAQGSLKLMGLQGKVVDLVYNRTTDFFLKEERHHTLRQAWAEKLAVVTPQPQEYRGLADKNLLIEMENSQAGLPDSIKQVLLATFDLKSFPDHEKLWAARKKFFFKPKNSFGGKSAYRGQSLSHKVFDRIMKEDPLIQELFPPEKLEEWKFDVRCYVYEDHIDHITARLYQGQLTNFSAPYGGFCPVRLKS